MIDRTSNQRQIPVSKAAAHITGNTSQVLTVFSGKIKSANDTINTNDVEPSRASDRGARRCWCR